MKIGELALASGVNAKLIRHYESIGLIPKAERTRSGYRNYSEQDASLLRLIRRARGLGFSMKEIRQLIGLWNNKKRASKDVRALALGHLRELEAKIEEMKAMAEQIRSLVAECHADDQPDCSILKALQ